MFLHTVGGCTLPDTGKASDKLHDQAEAVHFDCSALPGYLKHVHIRHHIVPCCHDDDIERSQKRMIWAVCCTYTFSSCDSLICQVGHGHCTIFEQ